MSDWLLSLRGTEAGHHLAMALALQAAFLHAVFGALQKGRHDPWLTRGAIDASCSLFAAPVALFFVPWPEPHMWPIFFWVFIIHLGYKILQGLAYTRGAYTVVYPVVRGTGPLLTVIGAYLLFGEVFTLVQWFGVVLLVSGIFGLALFNAVYLQRGRDTLGMAMAFALATGLFVALYTTYDAYGIRAASDPFTFLAWFFMFDGWLLPPLIFYYWAGLPDPPPLKPLMLRGCIGAVVAFMSFGSVMLATLLGKVGEAAVLRETSTIFAAAIGWLVLKETVGLQRIGLMTLIALGAVVVEMGG